MFLLGSGWSMRPTGARRRVDSAFGLTGHQPVLVVDLFRPEQAERTTHRPRSDDPDPQGATLLGGRVGLSGQEPGAQWQKAGCEDESGGGRPRREKKVAPRLPALIPSR